MSDRVADLEDARRRHERVAAEIEDHGETRVVAAADAYREAVGLLERYRDSATGTGDFEAYVEFQDAFSSLVEGLDDDLPARDAFEAAAELVDQRRLNDRDFERAREELEPAEAFVDLLDRHDEIEEDLRTARHAVRQRLDDVDGRIDDLERLKTLGEADLRAPVERIREPIEAYDAAVREAFDEFASEASARRLFDLIETADAYPLVDFRQPPAALQEYVATHEAGDEPVPTLLEYADYSTSKLSHYVDDPGALKARVAVHRTYLERLDGAPLVVGWPPPTADRLRFRARELVSVAGRFAPEDVVDLARTVRDLPRETDYPRLREAAVARADLTETERERLTDGAVDAELADLRAERERLAGALE